MTVPASCARAVPHRDAAQSAASAIFFTIRFPLFGLWRLFWSYGGPTASGRDDELNAAMPGACGTSASTSIADPLRAPRSFGRVTKNQSIVGATSWDR